MENVKFTLEQFSVDGDSVNIKAVCKFGNRDLLLVQVLMIDIKFHLLDEHSGNVVDLKACRTCIWGVELNGYLIICRMRENAMHRGPSAGHGNTKVLRCRAGCQIVGNGHPD